MLFLHEITDDRLLDDLAPEWDDLLGRCSHATVFQTWEWLAMCRRCFGRGKRLMTLAIRDGERLVGLAPFEIARIYGSPLHRLQFIGTGRSDYLDIITDDGVRVAVLQAVLGWIDENRSRWDVVDLQEIPESSRAVTSIADDACRRDFAVVNETANPDAGTICGRGYRSPIGKPLLQVMDQELCPYMPLASTWEETIAPLGKKTRYNLGYYERLMRRQFDVEIGMVDGDRLDEGLDALFRLHTQRWRRRRLPGVLSGDHTRAFHRELASMFLKRGWLRLHTLRLDGEIRAILYCIAYKSRTCYYIGGFDPELSRYSVGTVLTGYAIRQAVEEGCTEFDFLRGNEGYKARWTDRARMNGRIVIGKAGIKSTSSVAVCRLEMKIEHAAKEWMHRRFGGKPTGRGDTGTR